MTCEKCSRKFNMTETKLKELFDRSDKEGNRFTWGWRRLYHYQYVYDSFLFWSWKTGERKIITEGFMLHYCPGCINEKDLKKYERILKDNIGKLAEIEAQLVKERLALDESQGIINENQGLLEERGGSVGHLNKLLKDKSKAREETAKAEKEAKESLEKLEAEKRRREEKDKEIENERKKTEAKEKEAKEAKRIAREKEQEAVEAQRKIEEKEREIQEMKNKQVEEQKQYKLSIAKELLRQKINIDTIIMATGLLREEIEKLS